MRKINWAKLANQLSTAPSNGETTIANHNANRQVLIEKAREEAIANGEDPNRAEEDIMRRTGTVAAAFPLALVIAGAGTAVAANPALYGKAAFETATSMAGGTGVEAASEALTGKTFGENIAHYTGADKAYQNNALARFGFDMLNPGYALGGGVGKTILGRIYPTVFNPNVGNAKNKWIANIAGSDGKIFNSKIVRNRNNYYRAVDKDAIIDANTSGLIRGVKARGNDNFPFFARSQEPYTYRKYVIEGTPDSAEWISTYPYAYSKNPEIVKMPKFAERDYSLGYETPIGSKDINGFQLTGGFDPEFLKGYEALPMTNGNVNGSNANNFSYWKRYPLFGWRHKNFNIKAIPSEQTPLKDPVSKQYASPNVTIIPSKKPWRSDPTKINDTKRFYISGQENKGYFELVKDFEDGNYSVHFKPTDASNPKAFSEIEKKALFQAVADAVPQGGNISTWGSVSPGGIAGINRFGNLGFIQTGTRDVVTKGEGAHIKIPIFTKPKPMYESPTIKETSFIPKNDIALKKLTHTEMNSPEWDLLDAPAVPENYGSSYYSNQVRPKEIQRLQKLETVVNNDKPVSKIDIAKKKFLNKSVREQDDMVRAFIGERFNSFESLKNNPKELNRFWNWISK